MNRVAIAVACVVSWGSAAPAATIVQTDSDERYYGVDKFNPNLGTLNAVTLEVNVLKRTENSLRVPGEASLPLSFSWATTGTWNMGTREFSVSMPITGSGTLNLTQGNTFPGLMTFFFVLNVTGSKTFELDPALFVAGPNTDARVLMNGSYQGFFNGDDTAYTGLPAGSTVQRVTRAGEDSNGYTYYRLTYHYDPAVSGVPEPATWAMMMLGFGGVGYAMRRKQKNNGRIRFA